MAEGFASVACFSITTLLVVSLANLILLIMMILESRKKCTVDSDVTDSAFRFGALQAEDKFSSLIHKNNIPSANSNFMAALVLLKGTSMTLICGTTIISKFWVVTTGHCCELIRIYPFEKLKLASNSENWRKGKKHSVENLVQHINFTAKSSSFNVCLVKAGSPFKEEHEKPIALSGSNYRYITDTSAITLGWSSNKGVVSNHVYSIDMNLISFQRCKTLIKTDRVDETMVCAYNIDRGDCRFDSGGPLIQNNILIGIVSFETDCAKRAPPRVFTRMSYFEKWFQVIEKQNGITIGAVFQN
ncbi:trypsin epsilon-like [Dendroctonus ponderosae]|uniref:trypsin epsilon-like n=1 Tax=Dendroctonus ponderosae TaxID=77166 RepID=UPI002034EBC8|nr:trypsin epsilon-like [Dendroctonus ponderosae]KAH1025141.1 hypothetical protein HUJ05_009924 [Dendroctonus ponderosae]